MLAGKPVLRIKAFAADSHTGFRFQKDLDFIVFSLIINRTDKRIPANDNVFKNSTCIKKLLRLLKNALRKKLT